jgi:hypothetical protein
MEPFIDIDGEDVECAKESLLTQPTRGLPRKIITIATPDKTNEPWQNEMFERFSQMKDKDVRIIERQRCLGKRR